MSELRDCQRERSYTQHFAKVLRNLQKVTNNIMPSTMFQRCGHVFKKKKTVHDLNILCTVIATSIPDHE